MLKEIFCASILAATALTAQAAPQTWNFVYSGFMLEEVQGYNADREVTTTWRADLTTSGFFTGEDLNHNNLIEQNELTKFVIDNRQYVGCDGNWGSGSCYFNSFSYATNGQLNFDVQNSWESSSNYGDSHRTIAGQIERNFYWNGAAAWTEYNKHWTAQTTFSITPPPAVPEPETYAMMGLGLLGLMALQRRRFSK